MKYNEKYDRYVDDDLIIYYWDKKKDKLMQSKVHKDKNGYLHVHTKLGHSLVHRVLFETMIGDIPEGMTIDHINTIKTDNRLENLRCVTQKENQNNPLSIKHQREAKKGKKLSSEHKSKISESLIGNTRVKGKTFSEFGKKFKEHFGITRYENIKLYDKEIMWYYNHNHKCRWEV